jgi:hypothetical protein
VLDVLFDTVRVKVKVKQTLYMPRETLRVAGVGGYQISRQKAHEDGKVSPTHWPPLPPENITGIHIN